MGCGNLLERRQIRILQVDSFWTWLVSYDCL